MRLVECAHTLLPLTDVTAKTLSNYLGAIDRYVAPLLSDSDLTEVTPADLLRVLAELPAPTHYQTLMALRVTYREALRFGYAASNPAKDLKPPKVRPRQQQFLTLEYVLATSFNDCTDLIRFIALHGLRWGEVAALESTDLRNNRVYISRSIHGDTKSRAGVRSVPYLGHFPTFIPSRSTVFRALQPHGVNIHTLRKTYAYALKSSGVHVTTAAKLMGHADPAVTLRIYTAVLDDEVDEAGAALQLHFDM